MSIQNADAAGPLRDLVRKGCMNGLLGNFEIYVYRGGRANTTSVSNLTRVHQRRRFVPFSLSFCFSLFAAFFSTRVPTSQN